MLIYVAKERQPFSFSDILAMKKLSADKLTKLIKSVQADDQRPEPIQYFTAD